MVDAGWLFTSPPGRPNSLNVSVREGMVVVEGSDTFLVQLQGGPISWHVSGGGPAANEFSLDGLESGRQLRLLVQIGSEGTRLLWGLHGVIGVYSNDGRSAVLLLRVSGPTGSEWLHSVVEPGGHLYIATESTPGEAVMDEWTGERLDVSRASSLGTIGPRSAGNPNRLTSCQGGLCRTYWQVAYSAPASGDLRCLPGGRMELDTGKVVVKFDSSGGTTNSCIPSPARHVEAGDPLDFRGPATVTAVSETGELLSVADALDGTLYVGKITPAVGCPCMHGN
jgi:hypothetical protein